MTKLRARGARREYREEAEGWEMREIERCVIASIRGTVIRVREGEREV